MKETTMPTVKKIVTVKGYSDPVVDSNLKSHANDPFVLKKVADAKEALGKMKLPDHLKK